MTKEQIQDRIKQLESERENVRASLVLYEGALQDCQFWLQKFEEAPVISTEESVEEEVSSLK